MNPLVVLFFAHSTFANFLLGFKFLAQKDKVFKKFGLGLIFNGLAFTVWSLAVLLKPENLEQWITVGVVPFIIALLYYLATGTLKLANSYRRTVMVLGVFAAAALFIVRTFILVSHPGFSPEGLFFFNAHSVVRALYVVGIAVAFVPAVDAVSAKLRQASHRTLFKSSALALTIGGILLVTSNDTTLLFIDGWVMGVAYLVLWTNFAVSSKALAKAN